MITAANTYYGGAHVCAIQNAFSAHNIGTACPSLTASINGPSTLGIGQVGTWTAVVSGGQTPYNYRWDYLLVCPGGGAYPVPLVENCDVWYYGGSSSSFSRSVGSNTTLQLKMTVTDAATTSVVTEKSVIVGAGSGRVDGLLEREAPPVTPLLADASPEALPTAYALEGNYPNPFNPVTTLRYALPEAATVRLVVYDLLGREVARLVEGVQQAGHHAVAFDGSGLASGVYLYRLEAGTFVQTRRMTLVK
jgi:hypothetical protein